VKWEKATAFTLLWPTIARINLQTLLDTTPPKRVPILWDGSAPAPSKEHFFQDLQLASKPITVLDGYRCSSGLRKLTLAPKIRRKIMLYWALVFLVVALIAGVLGFTGVAVASAGIAKILFIIFLVLFLVSLITHFARGRA
jgi:uncharacterized membrane protein YtjA (UPF0391 family)